MPVPPPWRPRNPPPTKPSRSDPSWQRPAPNPIKSPTPRRSYRRGPKSKQSPLLHLPASESAKKTLNYPPKLNIQTRPPAPPCHPGFPLSETFAQPSFPLPPPVIPAHPTNQERAIKPTNKPPFAHPISFNSRQKTQYTIESRRSIKAPAAPVTAWGEHHSIERRKPWRTKPLTFAARTVAVRPVSRPYTVRLVVCVSTSLPPTAKQPRLPLKH